MRKLENLQQRTGEGGVFRTRELEALGISRSTVQRIVERGEAEQLSHGLYRLVGGEITEHIGLVAVQKRIPDGIICLLSALQFHGIGTQLPREIWIAIDRKARKPGAPGFPIRVVRFSGVSAQHGVETHALLGVPVRVTSVARTVVDCFRYRNKIGIDIALEALKDVLARRLAPRDEILRTAEACRAVPVLRPYLEAMSI
jgi:predicted transcriptional regulator of viral defense system